MVYFPGDYRVDVTQDAYFDERFLSPICHTQGRFKGAYHIQVASVPAVEDTASRYQAYTTGSAFPFCIYYDEEEDDLKQVFALPTVEEIYSNSDEQAPEALHRHLVVDDPDSQ
jgi:hypothetical protein